MARYSKRRRYPWPRIVVTAGASSASRLGQDQSHEPAAEASVVAEAPTRALMVGMSTENIHATLLVEVNSLATIPDLTPDTLLVDAGIDSIAAFQLRNRIEEVIGVRLRNEDFLDNMASLSIASLTHAVQTADTQTPSGAGGQDTSFLYTSVVKCTASQVPQKLQNPILFVLSSPRSGSSLLQLCLQANPSLYAGQELYLLQFDTMGEREAMPEMRPLMDGLLKNVMELLGVTIDIARARVSQFGPDCPTWRVYESLQRMAGSRILVDKTPHNASHVNIMYRATETFGAARYIHLIRHPYACIASGLELFRIYFDLPDTTWTMVEQGWVQVNNACDEFVDFIGQAKGQLGRVLHVRYEDLLRDPAGATRQICEHLLGITWVPGMANPYETSAVESFMAVSRSSQAVTDPKLLKRKKIEPRQAEKWRDVVLPQPLLATSKQLALQHGYKLLVQEVSELMWITQPQQASAGPPVVCIHDFTGLLWGFRTLAPMISHTGCLGIRSSTRLLQGCDCMQDVAIKYLELLPRALWKKRQPIRLVAYSLGTHIAYRMACLLEADGQAVELVLLDGRAGGDEGYGPRLSGFAAQVAGEIRSRAGLPQSLGTGSDESGQASEHAATRFAAIRRGGYFEMLFSMLQDAGEDAAATSVRLIEMPDTVVRRLGLLESPVLVVSTQYVGKNTLPILTERIPQADVHHVAGDHFSFVTKNAEEVAEALSQWPSPRQSSSPPP